MMMAVAMAAVSGSIGVLGYTCIGELTSALHTVAASGQRAIMSAGLRQNIVIISRAAYLAAAPSADSIKAANEIIERNERELRERAWALEFSANPEFLADLVRIKQAYDDLNVQVRATVDAASEHAAKPQRPDSVADLRASVAKTRAAVEVLGRVVRTGGEFAHDSANATA